MCSSSRSTGTPTVAAAVRYGSESTGRSPWVGLHDPDVEVVEGLLLELVAWSVTAALLVLAIVLMLAARQ